MEIYRYEEGAFNIIMTVLYALGAIALLVLLGFIINSFISQVVAYKKNSQKLPLPLTNIFVIFSLIPLIGSVGLGNLFIESLCFDINMKTVKTENIIGDVEMVSCEEYPTRSDILRYKVEFDVNGYSFLPQNTFSESVIEAFISKDVLSIQYAVIENEGLYVYSIKRVE